MRSRGRPRKQQQQGSTSSAATATKEKEKEASKEKEARETGRERLRRRGKEKEMEMRGEGKQPATEKQKKPTQGKGKGKGKETEVEVEVREDGEQSDMEKEKKVYPQFFKVFFPEQSRERLKIPPSFYQYLKDQPTGIVSLKGPSGKRWQATLTSESEMWYLEQCWKHFATDHSLKHGYFLLFTYDAPSQFSVGVFSSLGINDPAALDAKPTNEVVVKIEEEEQGVQGNMDSGGGTSEVSILPTEEGNVVTGRRTRAMSGGGSKIPSLPTGEGHGVTGKRTRAMRDSPADANASKRHSTVTKKADKRRSQAGTSKNVHSKKDATFSLLDESKTFNKTQIRDKDVPSSGKFLLKKSRVPVVISQRRPVTEEEKELALRKANEFKSENPFTVQIMMESYVYVGFFMNIACEFVRESLPQTNKKMTLWDPLGKAWEVNYVYYSDRSVGSFSGGWGKFALGNNLEKYDVCVFELVKEDNIRVHIYRVVPEVTPLIRSSDR